MINMDAALASLVRGKGLVAALAETFVPFLPMKVAQMCLKFNRNLIEVPSTPDYISSNYSFL